MKRPNKSKSEIVLVESPPLGAPLKVIEFSPNSNKGARDFARIFGDGRKVTAVGFLDDDDMRLCIVGLSAADWEQVERFWSEVKGSVPKSVRTVGFHVPSVFFSIRTIERYAVETE